MKGRRIIVPSRLVITSRPLVVTFVRREVVIVCRKVSRTLWKWVIQLSGMGNIAEQYICKGVTCFFASIPLEKLTLLAKLIYEQSTN